MYATLRGGPKGYILVGGKRAPFGTGDAIMRVPGGPAVVRSGASAGAMLSAAEFDIDHD